MNFLSSCNIAVSSKTKEIVFFIGHAGKDNEGNLISAQFLNNPERDHKFSPWNNLRVVAGGLTPWFSWHNSR